MIFEFRDLVIAYLIPIIIAIVFLVVLFAVLRWVNRLGSEPEEDPAARAIRRRRGQ